MTFNWLPELGLELSFHTSVSNIFFCSLILFIGVGVLLYSLSYLKNYNIFKKAIFYSSLAVFTIAMLGLVLTDNLLSLFLFWEMTSVSSFFLIGFNNHKESVREKAKWALYTTVGGGLFLLYGILVLSMIGQESGLSILESLSLSTIIETRDLLNHQYISVAIISILIGICSKSALFPFSYWLPLAMAGPTPVSSFLHSATMVKAGLILAYKLQPLFQYSSLWSSALIIIGSISAVYAGTQCLFQRNLKTMLAYSTSCVLGILAILLGIASDISLLSFMLFVVAHALYKAALFQIAGYLDQTYKTMDFFELKGEITPYLPVKIAALLSSLSMIGIPLSLGFFAKEYIYLSSLKPSTMYALAAVFFYANATMGIQAVNFIKVFFGKDHRSDPSSKRDPKRPLLLFPAVMYSLTATVIAIIPNTVQINKVINLALITHFQNFSIVGLKLKLWHGFDYPYNIVVILSVLTILTSIFGSIVHTRFLERVSAFSSRFEDFSLWSLCKWLLDQCMYLFEKMETILQNGRLLRYLKVTLVAYSSLVLIGLLDITSFMMPDFGFTYAKALISIPILTGVGLSIYSSLHYRKLIYLALSGFFLVIYFGIHSAMDVSMTQLMVESLSLFFVFFLVRSVKEIEIIKKREWSNFFIATFFGAVFYSFFFVRGLDFTKDVSKFFLDNSYSLAKGENIVNVILVDFRAFDTFGEVIVVAIAIIGVTLVLTNKGRKSE